MAETLEWLEVALSIEKRGMEFYARCKEKTQNSFARQFFQWLTEEEKNHYKVVTEMMESAKKVLRYDPKWFVKRETKLFPEEDIGKVKDWNLAQMFNTAMKYEEEGIKLYGNVKPEDKATQEVLQRLTKDELEHKARIEEFGAKLFGIGR